MTWHYAAGYTVDHDGERHYGVYEVYDAGGTHTANPQAPYGDDRNELIDDLFRMAKDVMYFDEFEVEL